MQFPTLSLAILCISGFAAALPASSLTSRGTPAVCFSACNSAHLEINRMQHDTAGLCAPGSAFLDYKRACFECNSYNGGDNSDFPDVNVMCA